MLARVLVLLCALLAAPPAFAGSLRVTVLTPEGRPVADAVVALDAPHAGPIRFAWPMRIAQRNMQFEPFVLIAPAGATVAFPNLDDVRHQVYSFSQAGPFELRLYGHDETRSVQFRNVGVIAIGCNIHDQMSAFIYVVDTPYAAKTGADGVAVIPDVPAGAATLTVWHPYMRAPDNRLTHAVTIAADGNALSFSVRLRAPPEHHSAY
ncbi:MAG TPA: methylamine utilization protein [Caulobacterales bacterium]|nr:methylamine utilization protein [Caulobacterales bacterium]